MRRVFVIGIFFFFSVKAYSQTSFNEVEKISSFCKVWGFLKYYHPLVSKGKLDWDQEFVTKIKSLSFFHTPEELSRFYSEWIDGLGKVKDCKKCNTYIPDSLKLNFDLKWIDDSVLFTEKLRGQLHYIEKNRNKGKKYYVKKSLFGYTEFDNEKPYKDSVFPSSELRLLGLSRYWNIINYFFPYKYLIGENWNQVLEEMIPKFQDPKDTVHYHLAILELIAKTNDGHAGLITKYTNRYFGYKWAPFIFKLIDGKAVVTDFYNDSLSKIDDVRYGDVFMKVSGTEIGEIIKRKSKYIPASNEAARLRDAYFAIFNGYIDSVNVTFERDGMMRDKIIHRYKFLNLKYKWSKNNSDEPWKILNDNIGYVNMGLLKLKQVDEAMSKLENTKAIIFDVRNYPQGTMYRIAGFLNKEKKPFAKFTRQDLSYPGVFIRTAPYYCGNKNKNYYKGKVILLFNETTQSHAEFTCMALQTAPDVISIGSQTAGADGNVIVLTFPGGYQTWMTGLGVYYPDGRETQRIGIVPDIVIKPTIDGIRKKKDEVLEKAIEIIQEGK